MLEFIILFTSLFITGNDTIIIVIIVTIAIVADFFSYLCVFESHLLGF